MSQGRILYTVEDLKVGGLEKVIAATVLRLDKSKFTPEVWCLSRGGKIADDLIANGIRVRILGLTSYHNPANIAALARMMKAGRFHILHAHGYFASTFSRIAALLAGIPVILTHVHSTYHGYRKRNLWMEKFLSLFTDRVICVSQAVQRFVTDVEKISKDRTCVIYNGIDPLFPEPSPETRRRGKTRLGIDADDILFIMVASLTPVKGHAVLLNAMRDVMRRGFKAALLLVGDGPLGGELRARADELDLSSRVLFAGERDDVPCLLPLADIFLLSSVEREGLSIALVEAMAAGLPVIATRVGGNPEVVTDGTNGVLVPPNDSGSLAEAMIQLLLDAGLRNRMGRSGREIYEHTFTLSGMMRRQEDLYDHLLEETGHAV